MTKINWDTDPDISLHNPICYHILSDIDFSNNIRILMNMDMDIFSDTDFFVQPYWENAKLRTLFIYFRENEVENIDISIL